tara:strand:+ start:117991 stop:118782 length:792 start_codon:yes stop_codon:yes gene_type:complete
MDRRYAWFVAVLCIAGCSASAPQGKHALASPEHSEPPAINEQSSAFDAGVAASVPARAALPAALSVVRPNAEPVSESLTAAYAEGGSEPLIDGVMELYNTELTVRVAQPKEGMRVVATISVPGAAKPVRLGFADQKYADTLEVVGEELPAFPNRRLIVFQIFMESGEDYFTREIVTALVFVGDATKPPKVLWQGKGEFESAMGECETINVISFAPHGTSEAEVLRHREVVVSAPEDGEWLSGDAKECRAKAETTKRIARVKIP